MRVHVASINATDGLLVCKCDEETTVILSTVLNGFVKFTAVEVSYAIRCGAPSLTP